MFGVKTPGGNTSVPTQTQCEHIDSAKHTGSIRIPFYTRKLRLRGGKCLAQGHTASQGWAWDWTPSLDPRAHGVVFQIWPRLPQRMGPSLHPSLPWAPGKPLAATGPPVLSGEQGTADEASAERPPHSCVPMLAPRAVFSVIAHSFQLL